MDLISIHSGIYEVRDLQVMVSQFVIPAKKLSELEQQNNRQFAEVYVALNYLMNDKQAREAFETRKRIGFKPSDG